MSPSTATASGPIFAIGILQLGYPGKIFPGEGTSRKYNFVVEEGWYERAGVRLHWYEWRPEGPAREPALLLLHGLSSNARIWERMVAHLDGRRIVALDQRSHGLSDRPESGYALEDLGADAADLIADLGLGRPLVVGHSWGSAVALALSAEHPDLAAGLVVVDGATSS